ncbi:cytochrome c biogenesis protein ResB [Alkalicella caledoniensis]|uniref:Cytochrome c biogenesis protein ResB n=1 Tax=Alkalicella caledoniensis TaxID=2731377 RepID=A0A7G9W558_ALKCA|nr:cytochrome c biogenesis protein ResB [Alkalicella caledoniensis]QNO13820.1 cytochrome c biogenesis protein ResB [Alkalicella caledoniensis]
MKTGITLLIILAVLSIIGTLIPQEMPLHWYEHRYSPRVYNMISMFNLHDMYHSLWFSALFGLLTINLFMCSIIRLPKIYNRASKPYTLGKKFPVNFDLDGVIERFNKLGFKNIKTDGNLIYCSKGKIGYFGSWLTHVGLAVVVICYFIGRIYGFNMQISGLPSETLEVAGTNINVRIDDFLVDYREDFSINQYYSYISLSKDDETKEGIVSVNNPVKFNDYSFYQIATGWAVNMDIIHANEDTIKRPMYERDHYFLDENSIVRTMDIQPDVINNSPFPQNPRIVYQLIHNNRVESMNFIEPGRSLRWRGHTITFSNPQRYTVLEVSKDPALVWALFGSLLLTFGLIASFYINPMTLAARPLRDGGYTIYIHCFKNSDEWEERIIKTFKEGEITDDRKNVV